MVNAARKSRKFNDGAVNDVDQHIAFCTTIPLNPSAIRHFWTMTNRVAAPKNQSKNSNWSMWSMSITVLYALGSLAPTL